MTQVFLTNERCCSDHVKNTLTHTSAGSCIYISGRLRLNTSLGIRHKVLLSFTHCFFFIINVLMSVACFNLLSL